MSDSNTHVTLPDEPELQRRLLTVMDSDQLVRRLYPTLLESAGQTMTVRDFVVWLGEAMNRFLADKDPATITLVKTMYPMYIDAIIDDPSLREAAHWIRTEVYGEL